MSNRFTLPGLNKSWLTGWPLVGVLGVGLALVALLYGGATDDLDNACTMTVQADRVPVRPTPGTADAPTATLRKGTEVAAQPVTDSGYRKLNDGGWVPVAGVAATAGSVC